MRPTQTIRRRATSFWLGLLLMILLASSGVVGILMLMGVNVNPFAGETEDPFMVRIPINSRPIPAYARVAREDMLNPKTGGLMHQRIPPQAAVGMSISGVTADGTHVKNSHVESIRRDGDKVVFVIAEGHEVTQSKTLELGGAIMSINAIIGRVVKKDKRAGLGFQEATFFPRGTPAGIAGATPPGMRAVTLDASRLTGVHSLNAGDQIDLMASVSPSDNSNQSTTKAPTSSDSKTETMMLAQGAVVLKPVYVRNEATASASLTQGKRLQNVPKYEVAIAVAPDDVIPLQSALDKSLKITCIAHSMQQPENGSEAPKPATSANQRQVPVTVRAIYAYNVVSREAFFSPATRRMRLETVSQQEIDRQGIITSLNEALGSVARHDIPAGRFLRKSDLLSGSVKPSSKSKNEKTARRQARSRMRFASNKNSIGTHQDPRSTPAPTTVGDRPAVTRFIPPGYTAFAIPWNRLYGAEHLQIGDELDLLASYSLERDKEETEVETRPDGTTITRKRQDISTRTTLRTWDESMGMRSEPWFVASDAIVVGPVGFPAPAPALRALGDEANRRSSVANKKAFTGTPLLIAVEDRDVESVAAAFSSENVLFTVAFHPSAQNSETPSGMKRIVIAAQDVAAYEQMSSTMWKGNRRRPVSRLVPQDRFTSALTIEQLPEFEFRVLKKAKRRGEYFTKEDFLPNGASPGIAAAAGPEETIFAVADTEIEGLDSFQADDRVTILVRGVIQAPENVVVHGANLRRAVSSVIVPSARIVRASQGRQTVLSVANADLTRLQAALAGSVLKDGSRRSHLLAVALPRAADQDDEATQVVAPNDKRTVAKPGFSERQTSTTSHTSDQRQRANRKQIPAYDPVGEVKLLEAIIGRKRQWHAFAKEDQDESNAASIEFERQ